MEQENIISSGLLEMYALGLQTGEENVQVQQWISEHASIKTELDKIQRTLEHYARLHEVVPQEYLKTSVQGILLSNTDPKIRDIDTPIPTAKVVSFSQNFKWLAAASVILLIGSVLFNVVYYQKFQQADSDRIQAQTSLRSEQENQLALRQEMEVVQNDMNVVQSKYSKPVALDGLAAAPDAAAKIFWMKNTGEVYVDPSNLPIAPNGKQYQLWGIVDGKPVDGGMLSPIATDGKVHIQKMKSFGKAEAFAITLESAGGNPTPKGDMYVMGKII
ncbi:MAG: anti-sigma factor [Ferruginibacter sp.]